MADKTIKELAEELGVSKQAVWQKIKKKSSTDLRQFTSTKGNAVYVSVDGQNIIKSMFKKNINSKTSTGKTNKNVNEKDKTDDSELVFLRALVLDLQKEKKELHKLLDQQQQLTLQSNKRMEQLETQLKLETKKRQEEFHSPNTENLTDPPLTPEKKWWHFLR